MVSKLFVVNGKYPPRRLLKILARKRISKTVYVVVGKQEIGATC